MKTCIVSYVGNFSYEFSKTCGLGKLNDSDFLDSENRGETGDNEAQINIVKERKKSFSALQSHYCRKFIENDTWVRNSAVVPYVQPKYDKV